MCTTYVLECLAKENLAHLNHGDNFIQLVKSLSTYIVEFVNVGMWTPIHVTKSPIHLDNLLSCEMFHYKQ